MHATSASIAGDNVTERHPLTGKQMAGVVTWVSPTRQTVAVLLSDATLTYVFPDRDSAPALLPAVDTLAELTSA